MDKAFADQAVSNAFCPERLKRAIRLANWFHEELAGMLAADLGYRSRGTLERIINWIKGFKGAMVSQGDITDNNIGIDRLRTIWSLYPASIPTPHTPMTPSPEVELPPKVGLA